MGEGESIDQRHADMIGQLMRRRARAAFAAVDDDEIRIDAGLQHGLADGEEFPRMADSQLEAGGLAARKVPKLGGELQEADRRRERRVGRR